jgi:hypothetical protein
MSKQPVKFVETNNGRRDRSADSSFMRWAASALALALASFWIFGDDRTLYYVHELLRW